jgi:hypothetical protein
MGYKESSVAVFLTTLVNTSQVSSQLSQHAFLYYRNSFPLCFPRICVGRQT